MVEIVPEIKDLIEIRENRQYLSKKLFIDMVWFVGVFIVMICIISFDVWIYNIDPLLVVAGFICGFGVGSIVQKTLKIQWHKEYRKVVYRFGRDEIIIFVIYVIFLISRQWIFSHAVHGLNLSIFIFSFIAGTMMGRLTIIIAKIKQILRENHKITGIKD
ncbi:MAG: hypothetical protein WDK96_03220 [Candidatus Paceibacterota bacterium]|jgi:hypothetical protein